MLVAETNNSNGSSFFRSSVPLLIFFCSCFILFFLWLKYNKRTLHCAMSTYTVHQRVLRAIASECNSFSKFCNVFHPQPFYSRVSLYIDTQIKLTVILQALKHNLYLHPHHPPPSPCTSPCHRGWPCVSQWYPELCWIGRRPLVGSTSLDLTAPFSRLGLGCEANHATHKNHPHYRYPYQIDPNNKPCLRNSEMPESKV